MTPKTPLPTWLTDLGWQSTSPFREETRQHLLSVAKRDPRVIDLIARVQAKGEEGTAEWKWAQRICQEPNKVLSELHQRVPNPQDEEDILRLAAYRSDHSYAHFFTQYALRISSNDLAGDDRSAYHEVLKRITPIVAELQPDVAIGFAPQIHEIFAHTGDAVTAETQFLQLAEREPYKLLSQRKKFKDFSNREEILATAEEARLRIAPRTTLEESLNRGIEAVQQIEVEHGIRLQ